MNYTFMFTCRDNGGKFQCLTVKATDKQAAIKKGFARASKAAKGDITVWDCKSNMIF